MAANDNCKIEGLLPDPIARQLNALGYFSAKRLSAHVKYSHPFPTHEEMLSWIASAREDVDERAVAMLASMVDFGNDFDPENDDFSYAAKAIAQHGFDCFFRSAQIGGGQ